MFLGYRKGEKDKRPTFGAFDVETNKLGGDFLFATAVIEGGETQAFLNPAALLDYMYKNKDVLWYAHNAEYDWMYLLPELHVYTYEYDIEPRARGIGKIYEIAFYTQGKEHKRPQFRMRDSYAVFTFSLKDFTAKFSKLKKLDIGLDRGIIFDPSNPDHVEYAKRDVESLLECMVNFDALMFSSYKVHLKGTIAGTALRAWQSHLEEGTRFYRLDSKEQNDFLRKGYFGGIVYITKLSQYIKEVRTYDINSSYPNVMCKFGVPYGGGRFITLREMDYYGLPAFLGVEVDTKNVPDTDVHFIPYRADNGGVVWARGKFETVISSREYYAALEAGYEFKVNKVFAFDGVIYPFEEYISVCKSLRREHKGQALEQIAKLMQNSLYGKFGMSSVGMEYMLSISKPGDDWQIMSGRSEDGDYLIDMSDSDLWERQAEREAACMMPHWAAWITANARLELVNAIHVVGDNFLYADTDSVTVLPRGAELLEQSGLVNKTEYGGFKDEGPKYDWICRAPKFYTWRNSDGKIGYKAKGLPKSVLDRRYDLVERLHNGELEQVEYESVSSLLSFSKSNVRATMRKRRPTMTSNLQSWEVNETLTQALPLRLGNVA